jgi:hypothetical protein
MTALWGGLSVSFATVGLYSLRFFRLSEPTALLKVREVLWWGSEFAIRYVGVYNVDQERPFLDFIHWHLIVPVCGALAAWMKLAVLCGIAAMLVECGRRLVQGEYGSG